MSVFGRHHHVSEDASGMPDRFEVLDANGHIVQYSRDDFDMIFETKDAEEVQRQVGLGWLILAETEVREPGRGPSGEDLIPGIEGLRVGGLVGYEAGTTVTSYTIGFLRDDSQAGSET